MRPVSLLAFSLCAWPSLALAADPDVPGSLAVVRESYGFGDTAFVPDNFFGSPVEISGVIHRPEDLSGGPFPLVIVLHGRHSTCFDPNIPVDPDQDPFANASQEWPCFGGREEVPSREGYDYWGANLASHGYVVVSIGANGINAADDLVDDAGARARADLIAEHLELWQTFESTAEYGTTYNGAVDLQNVGLVGHSRGGEGVAAFVALDAARNLPYRVGAALLLAPTDFNRTVVTGVPLAVMLPYCDGDVFDLMGVHYYDDSRYAQPGDPAPKYVFEMAGSNHNFYNTVWSPGSFPDGGSVDDFLYVELTTGQSDPNCGVGASPRLGEAEQQQSFVAYANAFFRTHLGGETEHVPMLRGDVDPPAGAAAAAVRVSYMPADLPGERLVVNRIAELGSLVGNDLGALVEGDALATYELCGIGPDGGVEDFSHCVADPGTFMGDPFEGREPHVPGLAQLRLGFAGEARWTNALPEGTDVSSFVALQFRAAFDFEGPVGDSVTFSVALTDRDGTRASVGPRTWSEALDAPPGALYPVVPKLLLHGVRIPLAAFVAAESELDLTDVASIELVFDGGAGAILLSDLAFADELPPLPSDSSGSESDTGAPDSSSGDASSSTTLSASDTTIAGSDGTAASSDTSGPTQQGDDDGCGCAQSSPAAPWLALALLARRRRRQPNFPVM
ncbi:MAG: hypothetical protein IAG13_17310 [Deltaproteobacteria bacterium]|nr:hypothetical protein [Nannocystaceae bacterium]